MLECSICSRSFDDRFRVFAPPHPEPFDRIECARRAAAASGTNERVAPILLPTIEAFRPHAEPPPALIGRRVGIAALALSALVPAQAALAGGAALFTGGTAASVYLAAKPAPGAPASKPTVRVQTPFTAKGASPQVPARSLMNDPPAALAWERPASPKPAPAPRHASRSMVARQLQIAVARDAGAAQLSARPKPGKLAAPQRPTQSSTEPQTAPPMAESRPEPKSEPKLKPSHTQTPTDTQRPTETPKQKDTPKGKPRDTPKQKDTPKGKPTDTPKQKPPTAKSPSAGPPSAPPEPQPTPATPPESHPPTTSEPASNAPSDKPSNSQGQDGSHGNDKGQGNEKGGRGSGR
jgi:hypothetical protein